MLEYENMIGLMSLKELISAVHMSALFAISGTFSG